MCICVRRISSGVYPNTPSGVEINPFDGHNKFAYLYYIGQYFPYYIRTHIRTVTAIVVAVFSGSGRIRIMYVPGVLDRRIRSKSDGEGGGCVCVCVWRLKAKSKRTRSI